MIEMTIHKTDKIDYPVAEALNRLCANLSIAGGDIKKIMITSTQPQEGKSFVTFNLARAMAALGNKVVLVDADIRASVLRFRYKIDINSENAHYLGLSAYLSGRCEINEILGKTDFPNLDIVLAGKTVMNSFPLLNSPRLGALLNELARTHDLVLIDAAPIGTVIDAAMISPFCDGVIMVVSSGMVSGEELKNSVAQIEKTGCPVLGYVLNRADNFDYAKKKYSYYSGDRRKA